MVTDKNNDRANLGLCGPLFAVVLMVILLSPGIAMSQWPVDDFKVYFGKPWHTNNDIEIFLGRSYEKGIPLDSEEDRPAHIPQSTIDEIERYLGEVARQYQAMGFIAPKLEPEVKTESGERAYRIYLYDITEQGVPAIYDSDCSGGAQRRLIRVDTVHNPDWATFDAQGNITEIGYQNLAHELFHAVAASYPLILGSCDLGDWIVEGTAQAMGIEMARLLRNINQPNDADRWGLRRYHTPLRVRDNPGGQRQQDAYQSSSFWHYIGELVALEGGIPGPDFVVPDMSYLEELLKSHVIGGVSEANELKWIDQQLIANKRIGLKLNRVYPYFVTTFASYINRRLIPSTKGSEINARTSWLGRAFDGCQVAAVDINKPPVNLDVQLERVASRCWLLRSSATGPVAIQVTAKGAPPEQLSQLAVGTHDGAVVAKPKIVTVNNEDLAQWLFRIDAKPNEQTVFVISNVGEAAGETVPVTATVELAMSGWRSNMGQSR